MRKIIREKEPPRPSTRLNILPGEARTAVGTRRRTNAGRLVHQVRGDLDRVAMRCLKKDQTRRYETTNGLAMDVQRHPSKVPISARPPSPLYQLRKFVRRNQAAAVASADVLCALVVGLGAATQALLGERMAHRAADAAQSIAEKERPSSEAARSPAVSSLARIPPGPVA